MRNNNPDIKIYRLLVKNEAKRINKNQKIDLRCCDKIVKDEHKKHFDSNHKKQLEREKQGYFVRVDGITQIFIKYGENEGKRVKEYKYKLIDNVKKFH